MTSVPRPTTRSTARSSGGGSSGNRGTHGVAQVVIPHFCENTLYQEVRIQDAFMRTFLQRPDITTLVNSDDAQQQQCPEMHWPKCHICNKRTHSVCGTCSKPICSIGCICSCAWAHAEATAISVSLRLDMDYPAEDHCDSKRHPSELWNSTSGLATTRWHEQ